jgi:hypothetical protein
MGNSISQTAQVNDDPVVNGMFSVVSLLIVVAFRRVTHLVSVYLMKMVALSLHSYADFSH